MPKFEDDQELTPDVKAELIRARKPQAEVDHDRLNWWQEMAVATDEKVKWEVSLIRGMNAGLHGDQA
jgi:hypothetical protein